MVWIVFALFASGLTLVSLAGVALVFGGTGPHVDLPGPAPVIDIALLSAWCLSHSLLARPAGRAVLERCVPRPAVRALDVFVASTSLLLVVVLWQPLDAIVWRATGAVAWMLHSFAVVGLAFIAGAVLATGHDDFTGVAQVRRARDGLAASTPALVTGGLYRFVRHPMMTGALVALWSTPVMSADRALFALAMTVYVLAAIPHEERDLARTLGPDYAAWRKRTPALVPRLRPAGARRTPCRERS